MSDYCLSGDGSLTIHNLSVTNVKIIVNSFEGKKLTIASLLSDS